MFDIQVRFMEGGRPVGLDEFIAAVAAEIARPVHGQILNLPQGRPVVAEMPCRQWEEEPGRPRALAVGVNEAGKLLGLSPWTIRRYIAEGQIRSVRIGRRMLVPMEVLEKVIVEGLGRK